MHGVKLPCTFHSYDIVYDSQPYDNYDLLEAPASKASVICQAAQFQVTVNVCALVLSLAGAITGFGTPLRPIQLLWVTSLAISLDQMLRARRLKTKNLIHGDGTLMNYLSL